LFFEIKDQNHPDEEMLSITISKGVVRQSNLLSNTSKKESSYNGAFPEVHAILHEHLAPVPMS
jgi:hypothetical protein